MWSAEGEYVGFSNPVYAQGPVEFWLGNIEKEMRKTLFDQTAKAWQQYPEDGRRRK